MLEGAPVGRGSGLSEAVPAVRTIGIRNIPSASRSEPTQTEAEQNRHCRPAIKPRPLPQGGPPQHAAADAGGGNSKIPSGLERNIIDCCRILHGDVELNVGEVFMGTDRRSFLKCALAGYAAARIGAAPGSAQNVPPSRRWTPQSTFTRKRRRRIWRCPIWRAYSIPSPSRKLGNAGLFRVPRNMTGLIQVRDGSPVIPDQIQPRFSLRSTINMF